MPRKSASASRHFTLGDHTFKPLAKGEVDPLVAWMLAGNENPPKARQIKGAVPPTYLEGLAKEAGPRSPAARDLRKGQFCGHGSFVMSVFDIVIDAESRLELGIIPPSAKEQKQGANAVLLAARAHGKDDRWRLLFRRAWEDRGTCLSPKDAVALTAAEVKKLQVLPDRVAVAIGFEYPSDATSRDDVSWMTIDIFAMAGEGPVCVVDAELA